jgi:hypothetical protein
MYELNIKFSNNSEVKKSISEADLRVILSKKVFQGSELSANSVRWAYVITPSKTKKDLNRVLFGS